ncbi:MAG: DUF72 domain-containing protein [Candidatus Bathyarchaeota archaeon]
MSNIVLGTSGWSYREWVGPFYRKGIKSMMRAYTNVFRTAEINSTFYAYPSKGTVMGWTRYSPEDHVFCAKLPKIITHDKKLNLDAGVEYNLQSFCDLIRPLSLNGKLGCLLIQLPPKYSFDLEHLESFFEILPKEFRFAVEFRNISWINSDTWSLLEKYHVAYCIVDEPLLPPEVHVTTDFAYFRWHGHGENPWFDYRYSSDELEPWVPKLKNASSKVKKVFGYFNNHYHGYAVENCLQVLEMLGVLTPEQEEAKKNVNEHFNPKTKKSSLDQFF